MNVKPRDVVILNNSAFKYDKGANNHPAIVIGTDEDTIQVAICTDSNRPEGKKKFRSYELPWSACGLKTPTMVLCYKIGKTSKSNIHKVCGTLSADIYNNVIDEISKHKGFQQKFEDIYVEYN